MFLKVPQKPKLLLWAAVGFLVNFNWLPAKASFFLGRINLIVPLRFVFRCFHHLVFYFELIFVFYAGPNPLAVNEFQVAPLGAFLVSQAIARLPSGLIRFRHHRCCSELFYSLVD